MKVLCGSEKDLDDFMFSLSKCSRNESQEQSGMTVLVQSACNHTDDGHKVTDDDGKLLCSSLAI